MAIQSVRNVLNRYTPSHWKEPLALFFTQHSEILIIRRTKLRVIRTSTLRRTQSYRTARRAIGQFGIYCVLNLTQHNVGPTHLDHFGRIYISHTPTPLSVTLPFTPIDYGISGLGTQGCLSSSERKRPSSDKVLSKNNREILWWECCSHS